jgi:uncharacterized membrane protein
MWKKYERAVQATDDSMAPEQMRFACRIIKLRIKTHNRIYYLVMLTQIRNILWLNSTKGTHCCISMATMNTLLLKATFTPAIKKGMIDAL